MFTSLLKYSLIGMLFAIVPFFIVEEILAVSILTGYLLSSIFVVSSAWVIDFFIEAENKVFLKAFLISTGVRFIIVLAVFGILLSVTKIDEMFFTVSFLISYICQSIMEMILINQLLQNSSTKK